MLYFWCCFILKYLCILKIADFLKEIPCTRFVFFSGILKMISERWNFKLYTLTHGLEGVQVSKVNYFKCTL